MALTTEEALQMVDACEKNSVKFMEGFMYRYTDR